MCRHPALYVQSGADLEVGEWLGSGYEPVQRIGWA